MLIDRIDVFQCDAGWKRHGFVKLTTSAGVVGWGQVSHAFAGGGVDEDRVPFDELAQRLVRKDVFSPDCDAAITESGRHSWTAQQASGGIENALLDARARSRGVSVREMLGESQRERVPVYWSHCGSFRVTRPELIEAPPIREVSDLIQLGREVKDRGYKALKTNPLILNDGEPRRYKTNASDFAPMPLERLADAFDAQLSALREGAGPDIALMVDLGGGFNAGEIATLAEVMERYASAWLEVEGENSVLREARGKIDVPLATGERLCGEEYRKLVDDEAADVVIIDVLFNGLRESLAIAEMCARAGKQVAPHNCYSALGTAISGAFCSLVPNLRILETDVDQVCWEDDFVTSLPIVKEGYLHPFSGSGWGTEVDEQTARERILV